jgi:hypothetical protein
MSLEKLGLSLMLISALFINFIFYRKKKGENKIYGRNNFPNNQLMMLSKIAPSTDPQKPLTWNPPTKADTSQSINPLMTNKKSPKVKSVMGRVKRIRRGRKMVLTIPNRKAAANAAHQLSTHIIAGRK